MDSYIKNSEVIILLEYFQEMSSRIFWGKMANTKNKKIIEIQAFKLKCLLRCRKKKEWWNKTKYKYIIANLKKFYGGNRQINYRLNKIFNRNFKRTKNSKVTEI